MTQSLKTWNHWSETLTLKFLNVALASFILAVPATAFAGAWNLPQGQGQLITSYNFSDANDSFSDIEGLDTAIFFQKSELRVFYEHGLTENITAVVNAAHQDIDFSSAQSSLNFNGFDETELGLRYQLKRRDNSVLSVQGSYIIGGGPSDSSLETSSRKDSFEIRGLWGQSKEYENYVVFLDAQTAIRSRNVDSIEEWRSELTLGWQDKKKWTALVQGFYTDRDSFGQDGFVVPKQTSTKLGAVLIYEYKNNRSVRVGYLHTLDGRNFIKERTISIGSVVRY